MDKKKSRLRRARQTRLKIAELKVCKLTVHRSNMHIYAQVYSACGTKVLASSSTLEAELKTVLNGKGGSVAAAAVVGKTVAERAKNAGIESVAFDRSGFCYHGRVKALADAAREAGLRF
ncbi:MAG: 50S ribosomal protein L18 [Ottowia sp.]|nr:50S ribosomal protein L18 [Ottowia sp.]